MMRFNIPSWFGSIFQVDIPSWSKNCISLKLRFTFSYTDYSANDDAVASDECSLCRNALFRYIPADQSGDEFPDSIEGIILWRNVDIFIYKNIQFRHVRLDLF